MTFSKRIKNYKKFQRKKIYLKERENLLLLFASVAVLRVAVFVGTHSSKSCKTEIIKTNNKIGNRGVINFLKNINLGVNRSWKSWGEGHLFYFIFVSIGLIFPTTIEYWHEQNYLLFMLMIRLIN